MSRELQDRGFEDSAYERPNLEWVCGWAAEGRPCPLGPDAKGECVVTHQCTPSLRGDRWVCARSAAHGGSCEDGPFPDGTCCKPIPPCQPAPSLRRKRGRLSAWTTGVTVGLLALALTGDSAHDFISPGDVSLPHGSIGECTDCHSAGAGGTADWFTAALRGSTGANDSERCLACHETRLGEFSELPHSVSTPQLREVRGRVASQPASESQSIALALARVAEVPVGNGGELVCATCHQEHRGRNHDLTALSNDQCQVCHVKPFASLADGHPSFTNYPYERRTRIQFNHVAHKNDAYPEKRAFRCEDCHQIDLHGEVMLVTGYEEACGGCHAASVDTSTGRFKRSGLFPGNSSDGVPFLALPGFDPDTLEEYEVAVGQWPEDATFDLEDPLNPFMRLLLAADEQAGPALASLPDDLVFTELDELDEEGFEAVGVVIWGVKSLFYDIVVDGQAALQERLEGGLGRPLSPRELSILTANLDVESVRSAQREWFPDLLEEIPNYRDAEIASTDLVPSESSELEVAVGWYRSGSFDFRYRPSGHEDPFLRSWLEVSLERDAAAPEGVLESLFTSLASPSAEGGCVKCHSVDAVEGSFAANWHQKRRDLVERGANRFLHSPHMTVLSGERRAAQATAVPVEGEPAAAPVKQGEGACMQCHVLVEQSAKATDESFKGHDPYDFAGNFEPIEKATCASCHVSGGADDRCLNCHNYHVGERISTTAQREVAAPSESAHTASGLASPHPSS